MRDGVRKRMASIGAAATLASGALMGWFAIDAAGDQAGTSPTTASATDDDSSSSTAVFGSSTSTSGVDTRSGGS